MPTGCLYDILEVEGINIKFLVDTGTEISVISDQLRLEKIIDKLPTLSVMGITMNGIIPNQTTKVRKQIVTRLRVDKANENVTFLVLNGLVEEGILGNYFFDSHQTRIDYCT